MVLGPFASTQRFRSSRRTKRFLRPSGRAKQQARLPGRNPLLHSEPHNYQGALRSSSSSVAGEEESGGR